MVRHKNRFLVVHVTPEKQSVARSLTDRSIHAALQLTIQQLFGEQGLGETGALQVRGLDPHTDCVSCGHLEGAPEKFGQRSR